MRKYYDGEATSGGGGEQPEEQGIPAPDEFINYCVERASETTPSFFFERISAKNAAIAAYRHLSQKKEPVLPNLTEKEKNLIAFSLFSMGMKTGPPSFATFESIVQKIGIEKEFVDYAKSWLDYPKNVANKEP